MEDADRIPIDIGYEEAAAQPSDPRTTVREDGTIVIDVLAPQPCAPEPSAEQEIVVCATLPDYEQTQAAPPPEPNLNEKISQALSARIGPLEIGSFQNRDGTYTLGARIRF